jgi:hypothetical protein
MQCAPPRTPSSQDCPSMPRAVDDSLSPSATLQHEGVGLQAHWAPCWHSCCRLPFIRYCCRPEGHYRGHLLPGLQRSAAAGSTGVDNMRAHCHAMQLGICRCTCTSELQCAMLAAPIRSRGVQSCVQQHRQQLPGLALSVGGSVNEYRGVRVQAAHTTAATASAGWTILWWYQMQLQQALPVPFSGVHLHHRSP